MPGLNAGPSLILEPVVVRGDQRAQPHRQPERVVAVGPREARVFNNSTIHSLAARVARDLSVAGWMVVAVGNFSREAIPATTMPSQDGINQRAIAAKFGMRAEPRSSGLPILVPASRHRYERLLALRTRCDSLLNIREREELVG